MNKDLSITSVKLRTSLLESPFKPGKRILEMKERLKHVADILSKSPPPSESGDFLLLTKDKQFASWYKLDGKKITIGRLPECEIELQEDLVSRRHAEILRKDESWTIRDLGSANGIQVNGENLLERILCDGDVICIGDFEMIFVANQSI